MIQHPVLWPSAAEQHGQQALTKQQRQATEAARRERVGVYTEAARAFALYIASTLPAFYTHRFEMSHRLGAQGVRPRAIAEFQAEAEPLAAQAGAALRAAVLVLSDRDWLRLAAWFRAAVGIPPEPLRTLGQRAAEPLIRLLHGYGTGQEGHVLEPGTPAVNHHPFDLLRWPATGELVTVPVITEFGPTTRQVMQPPTHMAPFRAAAAAAVWVTERDADEVTR